MRKIPEALQDIISSNATLEFGFAHNLFNLTQLSKFLQPLVRARLQKEASVSAICMALSRLGKELPKATRPAIDRFRFRDLAIKANLVIISIEKESDTHRKVQALYSRLSRKAGVFNITEAAHQITLIFEERELEGALSVLGSKPLMKPTRASSVSVSFDPKYLSTPGFLYMVLQQLAIQGINILELSSTATELVLYVDPDEVTLAFDTLYERFMRRRGD